MAADHNVYSPSGRPVGPTDDPGAGRRGTSCRPPDPRPPSTATAVAARAVLPLPAEDGQDTTPGWSTRTVERRVHPAGEQVVVFAGQFRCLRPECSTSQRRMRFLPRMMRIPPRMLPVLRQGDRVRLPAATGGRARPRGSRTPGRRSGAGAAQGHGTRSRRGSARLRSRSAPARSPWLLRRSRCAGPRAVCSPLGVPLAQGSWRPGFPAVRPHAAVCGPRPRGGRRRPTARRARTGSSPRPSSAAPPRCPASGSHR